MIRKLQRTYALSEQGAKDLVKATAWTVAANLSLMVPMSILMLALIQIIDALTEGGDTTAGLWKIIAAGICLLLLIYWIHWMQYKALYIATYEESAVRRIHLGEKLRELPLSFFGQRDLSDLTSTMMSDSSALEQMFASYLPQLLGTMISTALIAIGLLAMDWRMGLAVLWVIPLALILLIVSRKLQDYFGVKNFYAKRAATDGLQELLETVKDIKACNQKEKYLTGLNEKLDRSEKATVRSELVTGTCITSVQAFLKLGLATTVLAGVSLFVRGQLNINMFLIFLIAA